MLNQEKIEQCADFLRQAQRLLFITGAGISAESGLPTYRGVSGLYNNERTEEGVEIEEALSGQMLASRPALTWKYLLQIATACEGKVANYAHHALARLESNWDVTIITQNIDGFHCQAGSSKVIEMHGNIRQLLCTCCDYVEPVSGFAHMQVPPRCRACGAPQRPDVVLFGEMLPQDAVSHYQSALSAGPDVVFSIGTSSVFPYISWPVEKALAEGVPTVEINPARTVLSDRVDIQLPVTAVSFFEQLIPRLLD